MRTAVDANVIYDYLLGPPDARAVAREAIAGALSVGPVSICPVTYAEVACGFPSPDEADAFLDQVGLLVDPFSAAALKRASAAWKGYTTQRGLDVQCPRCGRRSQLRCPDCLATSPGGST